MRKLLINYANVNAHVDINVLSLTLFLTMLETGENCSSNRSYADAVKKPNDKRSRVGIAYFLFFL